MMRDPLPWRGRPARAVSSVFKNRMLGRDAQATMMIIVGLWLTCVNGCAAKNAKAQPAAETSAASQSPPLTLAKYDLLLRNGQIVDGSGNPWFYGDVAIAGGKIAAVGSLEGAKADRTIDAAGL